MLALLLDDATGHSDVSISKISEREELAWAISIELGDRLGIKRRAADPSAFVGISTSSHLEEIACDLD